MSNKAQEMIRLAKIRNISMRPSIYSMLKLENRKVAGQFLIEKLTPEQLKRGRKGTVIA